ncbi:hypothetical protein EV643_106200 [Kribbella sp. VKM Ac-2527]|uniref:Uncharacterized protein n=1 Tax=Kribbella caucasensis TaxID=2512215 RepID=A0A4R6KGR5_9ACTN|nr:hypothetical protein [Kribbella sp. VKM Ac-2527]TDO49231.1 hypothetical protein EV643_106200 [Kribbella sp. VKM Ac-2527]
MAKGKDGKEREHRGFGKRTEQKHQDGQTRNKKDQERNPNPNTRAGREIIAAKKAAAKKQGGKSK